MISQEEAERVLAQAGFVATGEKIEGKPVGYLKRPGRVTLYFINRVVVGTNGYSGQHGKPDMSESYPEEALEGRDPIGMTIKETDALIQAYFDRRAAAKAAKAAQEG